jgi:hypothetical protein
MLLVQTLQTLYAVLSDLGAMHTNRVWTFDSLSDVRGFTVELLLQPASWLSAYHFCASACYSVW